MGNRLLRRNANLIGACLAATLLGPSSLAVGQFLLPGTAPASPPAANAPALASPGGAAAAPASTSGAQAAATTKIPIPVPNPRRKVQVAAATPPPPANNGLFGGLFGGNPAPPAKSTAPAGPGAVVTPNNGPPTQLVAPPVRYSPNMFVPQAQFSANDLTTLKKISAIFNSIKTMQGAFIQVGPRGEQAEGKFFLSRPGRIRFQYDPPAKLNVVSDGTSVAVEDGTTRTQNIYPLSKTPLKHLLSDKIDLSSQQVVAQMREISDMIALTISEQSFNDGVLTLFFDKTTYELRQWVVTDSQGLDTSVAIYNVSNDKPVADQMFRIAAQ